MTWQSGGSGGIPGVTSDNQTPGGEVIAGGLAVGDPTAASVPSFITLNGSVTVKDTVGVNADQDTMLYVRQHAGLTGDSISNALLVARNAALNGHQFTQPVVDIVDATGSTAPLLVVETNVTVQFQVDSDGVQVHGKLKTGASVTHTLGAYSGKAVPIYDEAGTLLGYMPLYA